MMSGRLEDRVFVVSGAGGDTGSATVQRLASEGARLVLLVGDHDHDAVSHLAATLNGKTALVTGDVAARDTAREAVQTALANFGRLDGVVAHAAGALERTPAAEAVSLLDRILNDTVRATYLLAQEAAREMEAGGSMVCLTAPGAAQVAQGFVAHNVVAGAITERLPVPSPLPWLPSESAPTPWHPARSAAPTPFAPDARQKRSLHIRWPADAGAGTRWRRWSRSSSVTTRRT